MRRRRVYMQQRATEQHHHHCHDRPDVHRLAEGPGVDQVIFRTAVQQVEDDRYQSGTQGNRRSSDSRRFPAAFSRAVAAASGAPADCSTSLAVRRLRGALRAGRPAPGGEGSEAIAEPITSFSRSVAEGTGTRRTGSSGASVPPIGRARLLVSRPGTRGPFEPDGAATVYRRLHEPEDGTL